MNMCANAAEALGALAAYAGEEKILNMLQAVLSHQDSDVRRNAVVALGKLPAMPEMRTFPKS